VATEKVIIKIIFSKLEKEYSVKNTATEIIKVTRVIRIADKYFSWRDST